MLKHQISGLNPYTRIMPNHIILQCLTRQESLLMFTRVCVWPQRLQLRRNPHPELRKASRAIIDLLFQSPCIDLTRSIKNCLLSQKKLLQKRLTCCIFRSATLVAPNSLIAVLSSSERTGRKKKKTYVSTAGAANTNYGAHCNLTFESPLNALDATCSETPEGSTPYTYAFCT